MIKNMIKRVLVEKRISFLDGGGWGTVFEGKVIDETDERYKVKTGIFGYEWVPKEGTHRRCRLIK